MRRTDHGAFGLTESCAGDARMRAGPDLAKTVPDLRAGVDQKLTAIRALRAQHESSVAALQVAEEAISRLNTEAQIGLVSEFLAT